jgi:hypothetical protein
MLACRKFMNWFILCWTLHWMYRCKIPLHPVSGLKWIVYIKYVTDRVWCNNNVLDMLQTGSGVIIMYWRSHYKRTLEFNLELQIYVVLTNNHLIAWVRLKCCVFIYIHSQIRQAVQHSICRNAVTSPLLRTLRVQKCSISRLHLLFGCVVFVYMFMIRWIASFGGVNSYNFCVCKPCTLATSSIMRRCKSDMGYSAKQGNTHRSTSHLAHI